MAKFKNVGYIATSKKDKKKFNLCLEGEGGTKTYFLLQGKPSAEDIERNPNMAKILENWPEWKKYNVVKVTDE